MEILRIPLMKLHLPRQFVLIVTFFAFLLMHFAHLLHCDHASVICVWIKNTLLVALILRIGNLLAIEVAHVLFLQLVHELHHVRGSHLIGASLGQLLLQVCDGKIFDPIRHLFRHKLFQLS